MIIADAFYQTHGVHLNNFIHNYFLNIRTISKITDKQFIQYLMIIKLIITEIWKKITVIWRKLPAMVNGGLSLLDTILRRFTVVNYGFDGWCDGDDVTVLGDHGDDVTDLMVMMWRIWWWWERENESDKQLGYEKKERLGNDHHAPIINWGRKKMININRGWGNRWTDEIPPMDLW